MNIKLECLVIFILLVESCKHAVAYLEYDGMVNIELKHALNPKNTDSFTYRANITIPSLNSGLSNIVQETLSQEDFEDLKWMYIVPVVLLVFISGATNTEQK